jgi:hypothetical protein
MIVENGQHEYEKLKMMTMIMNADINVRKTVNSIFVRKL